MDVNVLDLQELFVQPVRYEIPTFQRPYVWNHDGQWGPLWEDVQNTAEQFLEPTTPAKAHFLGAVVLQQQATMTGMLNNRLVVDGQQRLTTLQLLLDAVQEVFTQRGDDGPAKRLELLVLNNEAFRGDNPDHAFKVWPTMLDQEAFRHAMHNDLPSEKYNESPIVRAHEFFKLQSRQWLDAYENGNRSEALEKAVRNHLQLVVIDLLQSDDPHIIFETLNARGTPLLQSELVKNMVLSEASKAGLVSEAEDSRRLWTYDDKWWRKEIPQGRLLRPRVDVFLNYWLVMRKRDEVVASDVFSVFRRYYEDRKRPIPIEDIVEDIHGVGKAYQALEENAVPGMDTFLYRWDVMQMRVLTPILLWLLSSEVAPQQMKKSVLALESHLVRRMVCRMTTQGYNRLFISLLDHLNEKGGEHAGDTIVEYLAGQKSNVGLWPTDVQIEDAFASQPLYRLLTRGRLRIVLEGIEQELRTDKAETQAVPRNLTIEHIMPQNWRENWCLPIDVEDRNVAEERRDHLLHSMGNLTLVNTRLNSALSDAPWNEKRKTLNGHTTLFLNKSMIDEAPDVWDESAIAERAQCLAQEATKVWPYADDINRLSST